MGEKLVKAFDIVKAEKGISAQMRLAMITTMSSIAAKAAPDSPENIEKMETALKEITGKFIKLT